MRGSSTNCWRIKVIVTKFCATPKWSGQDRPGMGPATAKTPYFAWKPSGAISELNLRLFLQPLGEPMFEEGHSDLVLRVDEAAEAHPAADGAVPIRRRLVAG